MPPEDYLGTAFYTLFAAVAGAMGYTMRTVEKGLKVRWSRVLLEAGAAGFVGSLAHMICQAMDITGPWVGVIVGCFGWLGSNSSIMVLERLVYNKLGLDKPSEGQK